MKGGPVAQVGNIFQATNVPASVPGSRTSSSSNPPPLPVRPTAGADREFVDPLSSLLDDPQPPAGRAKTDSISEDHRTRITQQQPFALEKTAPPTSVVSPPPIPPKPVQESTPKKIENLLQEKNIDDYVDEFLESSPAEPPNPDALAPSAAALRLLSRMRAWKRVEVLAKQLLEDPSVENLEDIQLYYFVAMLKLGKPPFVELQRDLASFMKSKTTEENKDLNSKVTIALHLLQAELYQYTDNKGSSWKLNSIDELSSLRSHLSEYIDINDTRYILWWRRVTMSIVNVAVRTSNWRIALFSLDELRQKNNFTSPFQKIGYEIELLSRIGKIFLQMGNLEEGKVYMDLAEKADNERMKLAKEKGLSDVIEVSPRVRLNHGLLSFAHNHFYNAAESFQDVIKFERKREIDKKFTLEHSSSDSSLTSDDLISTVFCGLDIEENIMIEAVNNYSICSMYMCDLKLAVTTLESLICEDPTANMSEVVVFNLCTMYELTCDNEVTNRKKRVLQKVATRFCLHDISTLAFRMSS